MTEAPPTSPELTDEEISEQKAVRLGKPIMLWEMDGNPMGCG